MQHSQIWGRQTVKRRHEATLENTNQHSPTHYQDVCRVSQSLQC